MQPLMEPMQPFLVPIQPLMEPIQPLMAPMLTFTAGSREWTPDLHKLLGGSGSEAVRSGSEGYGTGPFSPGPGPDQDGTVWLAWAEFTHLFGTVQICTVPQRTAGPERARDLAAGTMAGGTMAGGTMAAVTGFEATWVRGVSAGGDEFSPAFEKNPRVDLEVLEDAEIQLEVYQPEIRGAHRSAGGANGAKAHRFTTVALYLRAVSPGSPAGSPGTGAKPQRIVAGNTRVASGQCHVTRGRYHVIAAAWAPGVEGRCEIEGEIEEGGTEISEGGANISESARTSGVLTVLCARLLALDFAESY